MKAKSKTLANIQNRRRYLPTILAAPKFMAMVVLTIALGLPPSVLAQPPSRVKNVLCAKLPNQLCRQAI